MSDVSLKVINTEGLHKEKNFICADKLVVELKNLSLRYKYQDQSSEMFSNGYRQAIRDVLSLIEQDEKEICVNAYDAFLIDLLNSIKKVTVNSDE